MDMTSPRLDTPACEPDSLESDASAEQEIELKLTTQPKNLPRLLSAVLKLDGTDKKSRKTTRIVSTYFDTEDRRMRRRGLTLRVRQKNGKRVQTIKSEGSSTSGMFARQEWTTPLEGKKPDLKAIMSAAVRNRMGLILPQELSALFKTDVKRTTVIVDHATAQGHTAKIELAFDLGKIVTTGTPKKKSKTAKISEVELELVEGETSAILDLAKVLAATAPTVLNVSSKVSRGFELCSDSYPKAATAEKVQLNKTLSIEDSMALILRQSLGQLLANRAAADCGKDIEGVHQARIAIRRIYSALSLYKEYLSGPGLAHIKKEIRWLIDALGEARDLDVFLDEVLPVVLADRPDDPDIAAVEAEAYKARTAAYRKVRAALNSRRYTKAMLTLASWIEERKWRAKTSTERLDAPLIDIAGQLIGKRHRKVLKLGKSFETLSTEQRHEVRIALKKVRYAAEFFVGLYPSMRARPFITAMRHLQNTLGASNDVATAEHLLDTLVKKAKGDRKTTESLTLGAGKILGWHTRAAHEAEINIVRQWVTFTESRPFWLST